MRTRRSRDEHAALFVEFANRVAHLTPQAWARLSTRCSSLNGPDFRALLARTALGAAPFKLQIPDPYRDRRSFRIVHGVSWAFTTSMFFAGEVASEFRAPGDSPALHRTTSTEWPMDDARLDAEFLIYNTLAPRERAQPGVATAVRAAGRAVLRHDWLSTEDFEAVYGYVEPDIPFAELARR